MEDLSQDRVGILRAWLERNSTDHPFAGPDHVARVVALSMEIGASEGADAKVIEAAALLHDIAVPICASNHYETGALLARGVLAEAGYGPQEIEAICHAIEAHSRYGGPEPATIEAKCLFDADAIDYVGAVGLMRGIGRASTRGEYFGDVAQCLSIGRNLADSVRGICHTGKGRALMEERIRNLDAVMAILRGELQ
ncbi:MAG: HD domain-containing protein [Bacillota bacterium]